MSVVPYSRMVPTIVVSLMLVACGQSGQQTVPQTESQSTQRATPSYFYTTLDYPGAASTFATGINDRREIVGYYVDSSSGDNHAFTLEKRRFKALKLSIAGVTVVQSQAQGINDRGWIVGNYTDSTGEKHGFELKDGRVKTIDVPGSNPDHSFGAFGINEAGKVVGQFCNDFCSDVGIEQGYLLSRGTFTTLAYPGSDDESGAASGINNHNEIVGYWEDTGGGEHGYMLQAGTYASIDVPSACFTFATGINNSGKILGWYGDSACTAHGFLLVGSQFTTLDVPGVESSGGAREHFLGINSARDVVGDYTDASGNTHGFLGQPGRPQ
jgi:probable HAF family extracellular repeat protein